MYCHGFFAVACHSATAAVADFGTVGPALPKLRESEVAGQASAAVPDDGLPLLGAQRHGVSGHHVVAARGIAGADEHAVATHAADELTLVLRRAGGCTDCPLEALGVDLVGAAPGRGLALPRTLATLRDGALGVVQQLQPELALELSRRLLRTGVVEVSARLRAVLADQGNGDVHVVVAILRQAVPDSDPAAICLPDLLAGVAHLLDESLADRRPLLVCELALVRGNRQGRVPHIRGHTVRRRGSGLGIHRPLVASDLRPEHAPRLIQVLGDCERRGAVKDPVSVHRDDGRVAGDEVRVGVLVGATFALEVGHEPTHAAAAGDVRDHSAATRATAAWICGSSALYSARAASASAGNCPSLFANFASWLMLLAV